jgi:ATP/maltotriose-dependent transcriptional regulator MalT
VPRAGQRRARTLAFLIEAAPEDGLPHARLLWVAAAMAASQNDYKAIGALSQESLRIGTLLKDAEVVGWSTTYQAVARWFAGDLAEAARLNESALSLARLMQLSQLELAALNLLAYVSLTTGDLDRVVELGGQGLEKSQVCGELWVRSLLLNVMSQAIWQRGDRRRAEALAQEGTSCCHALVTGSASRSFSRRWHGWRSSGMRTSGQPRSSGLPSTRVMRLPCR